MLYYGAKELVFDPWTRYQEKSATTFADEIEQLAIDLIDAGTNLIKPGISGHGN